MTLNISVGNSVWWMVIALCCAVTALLYLLLRKKTKNRNYRYEPAAARSWYALFLAHFGA